jgi:predicted metal-dependent phosphoesterase TrpH
MAIILFDGMRVDLHTHTLYSDSFSTPEDVVRTAMKKGLGGVAITDHNEFAGAERAIRFSEGKDILVIAGEEVLTDKGEVIGLFLEGKIGKGSFDEVVGEIRAQGGLVVLPHPCDRLRRGVLKKYPELAGVADAIETFNARVIFPQDNDNAALLASECGKASVGGSDSHFVFEVGAGWTEFDGEDEEEFRKAILKGKTRAGGRQSAPFVHGFGKFASFVNLFRR